MRKVFTGILCQAQQCAACSSLVKLAVEGTDKDIGVLCPLHKNEVSYLKNQLQDKTNLEQQSREEARNLTNSLGIKEREVNELQAQIRMLEMELTEKEESHSSQVNKLRSLETELNRLMSKIRFWRELLRKRVK